MENIKRLCLQQLKSIPDAQIVDVIKGKLHFD